MCVFTAPVECLSDMPVLAVQPAQRHPWGGMFEDTVAANNKVRSTSLQQTRQMLTSVQDFVLCCSWKI